MVWMLLFIGLFLASAVDVDAEAALRGYGGLMGPSGQIVAPADLQGMTGSELGAAIAADAFRTGWAMIRCRMALHARPGSPLATDRCV